MSAPPPPSSAPNTPTTPSYASILQSDPQKAADEALEDVHTRFLLNLPPEELATPDRIFFQIEQAWWFYDDLMCDHSDGTLPRFKTLKPFALKMFEISPLLQPMQDQFDQLWQQFTLYKRTISTYGTILLNKDCTKVILCQLWNSTSWTFPAGKVNQNEAGPDAGARETYEETGFDPNCQLGLTAQLLASNQVTWKTPLQEEDALVFQEKDGKRRTCYACRGVPENFPFAPVARKEVSEVAWHDLEDLPKKSFAVFPYMGQLKRWIQKTTGQRRKTPGKRRGGTPSRSQSGNRSRGKVRDDSGLVGLALPGEDDGWTEEDMFRANEKLLGRKVTYDGNPHHFAEKGFDGMDPHAFHVVGGSFMNSSGGITKLAPAPEHSKLQPLFRKSDEQDDEEGGLKPFFSEEGQTPWGEVVSDALVTQAEQSKKKKKKKGKSKSPKPADRTQSEADKALLKMLQSGGQAASARDASADVFMTDAEITARSQKEKAEGYVDDSAGNDEMLTKRATQQSAKEWIDEWVRNLPQTPATERFGDFRFDVDAIMLAMQNTGI